MKRPLLASTTACLLAVTVSGCYWLTSYQDLTSGLGDGGPPTDAQVADVVDASSPDGSAPGDADAMVEAGPFCPPDAGALVYCMDFDDVDAAALGLGTSQASAGIVSDMYVSPPGSLKVSLYAMASSGSYFVQLPFQPTTSRLEFEILTASLGAWVTTLSITLYQASTGDNQNLNVIVTPEGQFQVQEYFSLGDGGSAQNGHAGRGLDAGSTSTWHHVVLSLTVDDTSQQYLSGLTVDGQVVEADEPLQLSWAQGTANLGIGVTYGGESGPVFYFDNVRADFTL